MTAPRPRRKPKPREIALLLGGMFLVVGAAISAINSTDVAPRLEDLPRDSGTTGGARLHTANRGAPYLTVGIADRTYTISTFDRAWLDSIRSALPDGARVTVWGRDVPNGWRQIWQLRKGDSMVVSYGERKHAKEFSVSRTSQLATGMMILGALGLVLAIALRVQVTVRRA